MGIAGQTHISGGQRRTAPRWMRRGQSGQSLIILAIGFIALLAFVGIVTDVSLLFVRYNTLRRAVDAAALSAASQLRRVAPDPALLPAVDTGQAESLANVNLAARQFIELYGITPTDVVVETCASQTLNLYGTPPPGDPDYPPVVPVDRNNVPLLDYTAGVVNWAAPENPLAHPDDVRAYLELCTQDELKLVRVTAQVQSSTVFLRLFGIPSLLLTESAISQTAVLDVVLIMDVSESMLQETTYQDYADAGYGRAYIPVTLPFDVNAGYASTRTLNPTAGHYPPCTTSTGDPGLRVAGVCEKTCTITDPVLQEQSAENFGIEINGQCGTVLGFYNYLVSNTQAAIFSPGGLGVPESFVPTGVDVADANPIRSECQVRVSPSTIYNNSPIPSHLYNEYVTQFALNPTNRNLERLVTIDGSRYLFHGTVPTYNYFGCCNDPNGDGDFSDLVCEPFRTARNAAEGFLDRLDFLRGDRVAYVTFDRRAVVIDPDGGGPQSPMIETQSNLLDGVTVIRRGATEVLRQNLGVRAEPSFYVDTDNDGLWDAYRTLNGSTFPGGHIPLDQSNNYYDTTEVGILREHPIFGSCPLDVAGFGPEITNAYFDTFDGITYREMFVRTTPLDAIIDGTRPAFATSHVLTLLPPWQHFRSRYFSAEYRASCGGTNIGSALATASNGLYFHGRREGAVWLMVMLSDGAAAASNPVTRSNGGSPDVAQLPEPYFRDPVHGRYNPAAVPLGQYGAYGLCPYGTAGELGEVLLDQNFPFCSDRQPETRQFCSGVSGNPDLRPIDDWTNCIEQYDVDDYARDWADWVALADLPGTGNPARFGDEQLPIIFTIGFGLEYDPATNQPLDGYLGEELLRYIADVGDNNRIDDDYWQWVLSGGLESAQRDRIPNAVDITNPNDPNYGNPGPCEGNDGSRTTFTRFTTNQNCGFYYQAATTAAELNQVFEDIAARLFTRISQ
jgi:hypothetical protein